MAVGFSRIDSPTVSSRLSVRMAPNTCVESVRCFPRAVPPSTRERQIKERLQNQLVRFSFQQTLAKFTQDGRVKARVGELKTEQILPVQSPTNGFCRLLIRKPLGKLHQTHQQQTRGALLPVGHSRETNGQ